MFTLLIFTKEIVVPLHLGGLAVSPRGRSNGVPFGLNQSDRSCREQRSLHYARSQSGTPLCGSGLEVSGTAHPLKKAARSLPEGTLNSC